MPSSLYYVPDSLKVYENVESALIVTPHLLKHRFLILNSLFFLEITWIFSVNSPPPTVVQLKDHIRDHLNDHMIFPDFKCKSYKGFFLDEN